jgi:hypothetical protein
MLVIDCIFTSDYAKVKKKKHFYYMHIDNGNK